MKFNIFFFSLFGFLGFWSYNCQSLFALMKDTPSDEILGSSVK
jgi:hypothetical protein